MKIYLMCCFNEEFLLYVLLNMSKKLVSYAILTKNSLSNFWPFSIFMNTEGYWPSDKGNWGRQEEKL